MRSPETAYRSSRYPNARLMSMRAAAVARHGTLDGVVLTRGRHQYASEKRQALQIGKADWLRA